MSEETRDMLREQLESTRDSLTELWAAIDKDEPAEDDFDHDDTEEDGYERLSELPLEIVWEKGEPFAVVLGTGGPHVEIRGGTRHDGSAYTLHGYWGGEHVTLSGESITRTGEYFRELVEETDQ